MRAAQAAEGWLAAGLLLAPDWLAVAAFFAWLLAWGGKLLWA